MKKLTILVDMDDTIEQLLEAWVRGVNEKYGTHATYDDVVSWDVSSAFPGLSFKQVYEIPMQPGFWKTVEPIPGAAEALQRLMAAGHEVYIVTATPHDSVPEKMNDLLFKYFPFLTWHQVIITSNKKLIRGDVLIDDGVHNLEGGPYVKVLMTAPHNKNYDAEANGMIRVQNWDEIEAVISKLAESDDSVAQEEFVESKEKEPASGSRSWTREEATAWLQQWRAAAREGYKAVHGTYPNP